MKTIFLLIIVPHFVSINSFSNKKYNFDDVRNQKNELAVHTAASTMSIGNAAIVEGNGGQRIIEIMVTISQLSTAAITVNYNSKNGSAKEGSDYVATSGTLNFAPGERMKRISVTINGDQVCESSENFEVILSGISGATIGQGRGKVTIVNDDLNCGSTTLANNQSGHRLAFYEVRFTFTGYTTFTVGPPDCPIRSNGKVELAGLVSGLENVAPDDDISYTGDLQLDIDMDICSAKRQSNGEDKLCGMTVMGFGTVKTELEIYFDQRGGYIKIHEDANEFIKLVFGGCDQAETYEEQDMVPNKTIASIFNGYELPALTNRTLTVGRYVMTGEAGETVVEVLRKLN